MTARNQNQRIFFFAAVFFIFILAIFSFLKIKTLIKSADLVHNTTQVTLHLEKLIGTLKDAETAHRGYLLTHDTQFLEPFSAAIKEYPKSLKAVKQLTVGNEVLQKKMFGVERLARRRHDYLYKIIEVDKQHPPTVTELLIGKNIMDSLREEVNTMIAYENNLAGQRIEEYGRQIMLAPTTLLFLSLISLFIIIISYTKLNKSLLQAQQLKNETVRQAIELEQIKAQKKIEASDFRYHSMIASSPSMICILKGEEMIIETANDAIIETWGKGKDVLGKSLFEVLPEITAQGLKDRLQNVFKTGIPFQANEFPIQFSRKGEMQTSFHTFIYQPQRDINDIIEGVAIIATEVTPQAELHLKIKQREEEFSTMADNISQFAWMADHKGWIYWFNQRWYDYTGTTLEEMQGWGWKTALHPDHTDRVVKRLQHSWDTGETWEDTFPLKSKTGVYRWFLSRAIAIKDNNGKVIRWFGTNTDITSLREAEESLLKQQQFTQSIIEASPSLTYIFDLEYGNNIYISPQTMQVLGYTEKEVMEMGPSVLSNLLHEDDKDVAKERFEKLLADTADEILEAEYRMRKKDGSYVWLFDRARVFSRNAEGKPTQLVGVTTDISQRKQTEELLKKTTDQLEITFAHVPAIIYLYDKNKEVIFANDKAVQVIGFASSKEFRASGNKYQHVVDTIGLMFDVFDEKGGPLRREEFPTNITFSTGKPSEITLLLVNRSTGVKTWFNAKSSPIFNENGDIEMVLTTSTDVTLSKLAETSIRKSEERFRTLADFMPQKIWMTDDKGNLTYHNRQYFAYTGLTLEQFKKAGWETYIHPDDLEERNKRWQHSLATGESYEMEVRIKDKNGNYIWHLKRAMPFKDENNKIIMWIGSDTEIQKTKEEQRKKDDFVKIVSHELKTPVTSIKGYIQLMMMMVEEDKEKYPLQFKSSLSRIDSQIMRLTNLITEMLDLSRIEAGRIDYQMENFLINELVTEVVQDIRHTHPEHIIMLMHDYTTEVHGDRDRLGQVLINLINNAIKYSPGQEKLEVTVTKGTSGFVAVQVKDYGIGINKNEHEKIFERFYRAEGDKENTFAGFGIGLYIANDIVQKHAGRITVESEPGKGSLFTFHLPIVK
ncbi:PAS domain S-box protein [Lacibacter sp. H375]|uniref:PAS domain S-box protein n=1 Tax=Lacibacter sp. H375 TaxID=3133424 RepID=UPI0030C2F463